MIKQKQKIITVIAVLVLIIVGIAEVVFFCSVYRRIGETENEILQLKSELSSLKSLYDSQEIKQATNQDNIVSITRRIEDAEKKLQQLTAKDDPFKIAIDNLDKSVFVTDPENYAPDSDEVKITEKQAQKIAKKGFEESKSRIAGEGADNIDSETVVLESRVANNYFTRYGTEGNKSYSTPRKCYVITRTNEMRNGISIYVDATTGLIIGGDAFGD